VTPPPGVSATPDLATSADQSADLPEPASSPAPERGTVYRAQRRPGLTTPGVAVILTAIAMVAGLLSGFLINGIGWLFGVPFVLATAYCGWEVRWTNRWSVVVAPPLVLLATLLVVQPVTSTGGGLRGVTTGALVTLVASAPMLMAAEIAAGITLGWRAWQLRVGRR